MNPASGNDTKEQGLSRIGFYDIERTIGKGNFAVVRLARHRITKSYVAVKIINKSKLDDVNLRKMYREIQIMQLINHPQIIKLYQVIETKTMLYLVTEYAENGELFDYVSKHGRMSEQNAKTVFAQIGSAVKYLHDNKIVHRDLKTENLLFDSHNRVKLADFGFANFFSDSDLLSTWCGSPPYAAPEVFEGLKYHGPEIDIWSLGVILYVLVCGILPFSGDTLQALRDHVLSCHFRVPFFLSTVCEDLIKRMLVRNPVKRLTIADVLRHPWLGGAVCSEWQQPAPAITAEQRESILRLMQSLGISPARVMQSVESNAFDNYASMYYLLAEKGVGRTRRTDLIRRPSSLAEQAIEQATGSVNASPLVASSPVPSVYNGNISSSPFATSTNSGVLIDGFTVKAVSSSGFGFSLNDSSACGSVDGENQSSGLYLSNSPGNNNNNQPALATTLFQQQQTAAAGGNSTANYNVPDFRLSPFGTMPGPKPQQTLQGGFLETGQSGHPTLRAFASSAQQQQQQFLQQQQLQPQGQMEQPLFAAPALSLQQHHQYMSATSVPNSSAASAQSALAALHPFVFMNSHLLPASYYGAFVLQQLQLQHQHQQATAAASGLDASANNNSFESSLMDTSSMSVIRPNPLCYRPTSDLPPNPIAFVHQQIERDSGDFSFDATNQPPPPNAAPGNVFAGRPPPGPASSGASTRRPPLLKRASLPADVGGHSLASVVNSANASNNFDGFAMSGINSNNSASSMVSFSRPAGADYAQHAFVPKSSRRFHNAVKLSPYPLPTQVELPSPAADSLQSPPHQQRFVFMPSLSHPGGCFGGNSNNSTSGSTAQLQVATELLTIDEQPPASSVSSHNLNNNNNFNNNNNNLNAASSSITPDPQTISFLASPASLFSAANVRSSRSVDVELVASRFSPTVFIKGSGSPSPSNNNNFNDNSNNSSQLATTTDAQPTASSNS